MTDPRQDIDPNDAAPPGPPTNEDRREFVKKFAAWGTPAIFLLLSPSSSHAINSDGAD